MNYQFIHDKLPNSILDHPNLNPKVLPFIVQYIKNLKSRCRGIRMAITDEEKRLAVDLYERYNDVFGSIFDALQEANVIDYSTSDLLNRGRKSGRLAIKINEQIVEGETLRNLFLNALKFIVDNNYIERLPLPWGVSSSRYVISNDIVPIYPNGRNLFYPVEYKGYTIESHYSRDR